MEPSQIRLRVCPAHYCPDSAQQGVRAEQRFRSCCRVLPGQTPPATCPACAHNLCICCAPRDVSKVNLSRHFLKLGKFAIGTGF